MLDLGAMLRRLYELDRAAMPLDDLPHLGSRERRARGPARASSASAGTPRADRGCGAASTRAGGAEGAARTGCATGPGRPRARRDVEHAGTRRCSSRRSLQRACAEGRATSTRSRTSRIRTARGRAHRSRRSGSSADLRSAPGRASPFPPRCRARRISKALCERTGEPAHPATEIECPSAPHRFAETVRGLEHLSRSPLRRCRRTSANSQRPPRCSAPVTDRPERVDCSRAPPTPACAVRVRHAWPSS